jgi:hypothetical protein
MIPKKDAPTSTASSEDGRRNGTSAQSAVAHTVGGEADRPRVPGVADVLIPSEKRRELPSPGVEVRELCGEIARRARDAFREACDSSDEVQAEAAYTVARTCAKDLWDYARYRAQPFRDLLATLEIAITARNIRDFDANQKEAIRGAFEDLARWHLDDAAVLVHIGNFVEHNIDLAAPIKAHRAKRVRVSIEELE